MGHLGEVNIFVVDRVLPSVRVVHPGPSERLMRARPCRQKTCRGSFWLSSHFSTRPIFPRFATWRSASTTRLRSRGRCRWFSNLLRWSHLLRCWWFRILLLVHFLVLVLGIVRKIGTVR